MKTKKGLVMRQLGNEFILVDEGGSLANFNKMVSLNATAALLWREVEGKEFDTEALVGILKDNYDISRDTAQHDVADLLLTWREAGIIED